ncbi:MAG: hypothetical protein WCI02_08360 [Planctomycetota bacterium]
MVSASTSTSCFHGTISHLFAPKSTLRASDSAVGRWGYWEQRADAILVASPNHISNNPSNGTAMDSLEIFRIQVRQLLSAKKWRQPSLAVGPKIDARIKL